MLNLCLQECISYLDELGPAKTLISKGMQYNYYDLSIEKFDLKVVREIMPLLNTIKDKSLWEYSDVKDFINWNVSCLSSKDKKRLSLIVYFLFILPIIQSAYVRPDVKCDLELWKKIDAIYANDVQVRIRHNKILTVVSNGENLVRVEFKDPAYLFKVEFWLNKEEDTFSEKDLEILGITDVKKSGSIIQAKMNMLRLADEYWYVNIDKRNVYKDAVNKIMKGRFKSVDIAYAMSPRDRRAYGIKRER